MMRNILIVASIMVFGMTGVVRSMETPSESEERLELIETAIILLSIKIKDLEEEKAQSEDVKELSDKLEEIRKLIEPKRKGSFMGRRRLPTA
ncbi:MAG: hypothetical protein K2X93_06765 [Candidatus Obscuribacterales bacterium]|nr:hypothetical protein [Candidatus Obscuribacterales bacterium]